VGIGGGGGIGEVIARLSRGRRTTLSFTFNTIVARSFELSSIESSCGTESAGRH